MVAAVVVTGVALGWSPAAWVALGWSPAAGMAPLGWPATAAAAAAAAGPRHLPGGRGDSARRGRDLPSSQGRNGAAGGGCVTGTATAWRRPASHHRRHGHPRGGARCRGPRRRHRRRPSPRGGPTARRAGGGGGGREVWRPPRQPVEQSG
ncbi:hypothetical protein I4F81_000148 [Pyropia yezoensis]|uniref:Uncharacterized protein n=1 Tax=Pyropia yezoensis TaxID=2788 RepID=A0ACC3BIE4_PYRYE|nr:hypothetical protein I4F81_000148 [Neopyropia yezoensis]